MPGRQKTSSKREEILAAAAEEFSQRDFHRVLVDDVSTRAGVGKGTVYRYFPTKEELFLASVFRGLDEFHGPFLEMFESAAPLEEILAAAVARMLEYFRGRAEFFALLQRYEHRLPSADADAWRRKRTEAVGAVSEALAREMRRGTLRSADPVLCAELFFGMIRTAVQSSLAEAREPSAVASQIVSVFLDGVREPRPAETKRALRVARGGGPR